MYNGDFMLERKLIDEKYKWDLSEYCSNLEKWEQDFDFVKNNFKLRKYFVLCKFSK